MEWGVDRSGFKMLLLQSLKLCIYFSEKKQNPNSKSNKKIDSLVKLSLNRAIPNTLYYCKTQQSGVT
jgi:hypothetical protein